LRVAVHVCRPGKAARFHLASGSRPLGGSRFGGRWVGRRIPAGGRKKGVPPRPVDRRVALRSAFFPFQKRPPRPPPFLAPVENDPVSLRVPRGGNEVWRVGPAEKPAPPAGRAFFSAGRLGSLRRELPSLVPRAGQRPKGLPSGPPPGPKTPRGGPLFFFSNRMAPTAAERTGTLGRRVLCSRLNCRFGVVQHQRAPPRNNRLMFVFSQYNLPGPPPDSGAGAGLSTVLARKNSPPPSIHGSRIPEGVFRPRPSSIHMGGATGTGPPPPSKKNRSLQAPRSTCPLHRHPSPPPSQTPFLLRREDEWSSPPRPQALRPPLLTRTRS